MYIIYNTLGISLRLMEFVTMTKLDIDATVDMLNHELFIKNKFDWEVDVSITDDQGIDLWHGKSGDLLKSFEDCEEAISAIQAIRPEPARDGWKAQWS